MTRAGTLFGGEQHRDGGRDLATPHAHVDAVDGKDSPAKSLAETVGLDNREVVRCWSVDVVGM